jgi:hypothetical protein
LPLIALRLRKSSRSGNRQHVPFELHLGVRLVNSGHLGPEKPGIGGLQDVDTRLNDALRRGFVLDLAAIEFGGLGHDKSLLWKWFLIRADG